MKKKIALLLLLNFLFMNLNSFTFAVTEHINISEKMAKKSPTNLVINDDNKVIIVESNVIEAAFTQDFSTKTAKVGDKVDFILNNGLCTKEGTKILPDGTILVSKVTSIVKPKSFNRSGKVTLEFLSFITPNGVNIPINAKVFNKKGFLSRGKANALGKGLATTLGAGGIGVGAGCGIGAAAGAVIVGGFAIGLPVGIVVGALAGYVTPGLHYKAKAGDTIPIQITDDVVLAK